MKTKLLSVYTFVNGKRRELSLNFENAVSEFIKVCTKRKVHNYVYAEYCVIENCHVITVVIAEYDKIKNELYKYTRKNSEL